MNTEKLSDEYDHYELYGKVDFTLEEKIGYKLFGHENFKQKMDKWSVPQLRERLGLISPQLYTEEHRILFYLLQFELSKRSVAPYWRGTQRIQGVNIRRGRELIESEVRFANDCQIVDMEWVHRIYPEHKTSSQWKGMYEDLFRQKDFNLKQANIIACAEFTGEHKINELRLNVDMQKQLFVLRTETVRKSMIKLDKHCEQVEVDLITASQRNRRRGQKLRDHIDSRVSIWACTELVENSSITNMCDFYQKMTGDSIHPSTFKRKLESTNMALKEVNSKHVF